ncbi:MAG: ABC transporter permease [Halanaerobiales bacterium]|nr:ABC transporter permease [Halanaerobiales bacterium]
MKKVERFFLENRYIRGVILLLLIWQILAWVINHPALPEPWRVLVKVKEFGPELMIHFVRSGYRIFMGIFLALSLGIPVGIALGYWKLFDEIVSPLIYLIYPIPKVAFLPLILLLLGLGDLAKIFLIAFILIFQIIVVVRDSVKDLPKEYLYSIRSLGAKDRQVLYHVIFPAIMPKLLTSLRLSIGTAIAVLFFAETFATYQGLGYYILDAWTILDYEKMFFGIVGLSILGLFFFVLVDLTERWIVKWK